jgi:hypothetical protein
MNERQWWRTKVQPQLHQAPKRLALKIQDAFVKGRPDVLFTMQDGSDNQIAGFIELKYDPSWPKRTTTQIDVGLTSEQKRHLQQWYQSTKDHRTALVLFGVGTEWFLFTHDDEVVEPLTHWTKDEIIARSVTCGTITQVGELFDRLLEYDKEMHHVGRR